MNKQALIHYTNYLAFVSLLETASPERKQLLEEERDRNEMLYLRYSEDDGHLEELGFKKVDGKSFIENDSTNRTTD